MFRLPYGYKVNPDDQTVINEKEAVNVKFIFQNYLSGDSIGKIAAKLSDAGISPPFENRTWSYETINKMLSNGRYVPHLLNEKEFFDVQFEKDRRSSIDPDTGKRKTARYNSQNVLGGLLVCGECGNNYRRISRPSGEAVWRCADRVENGKKAVCTNLHTVSDIEIKQMICEKLDIQDFDEAAVKENIELVAIKKDSVDVCLKEPQQFGMTTL